MYLTGINSIVTFTTRSAFHGAIRVKHKQNKDQWYGVINLKEVEKFELLIAMVGKDFEMLLIFFQNYFLKFYDKGYAI